MKAATLFRLYAAIATALIFSIAGLLLYSLDKSSWWDARTRLAQESHALHLQLESNLFRLFKQRGDALLIGDRDEGAAERMLQQRIAGNLADIRNTIAREIQMVGEEEIEELELLDEMEADIRSISTALATFSASGEPLDTAAQIERLANLLHQEIDVTLSDKIKDALAEEMEEVEEVIADAAAFRARNRMIVIGMLVLAVVLVLGGLVSYRNQIQRPMDRLQRNMTRLQNADYSTPTALQGSSEFRDLSALLTSMAHALSQREATRAEQKAELEARIATRTSELQVLVKQLETGAENRKRLMADISHELRTPLAIMLGEAEIALRTNTDINHNLADALARIREAAKHTNQIVDDMLTIARHEAGQLRLDRRETDLRKVLRDAIQMFPKSVQLDMPETPVYLQADEVRLRQSVLALFQNARRYGGPTIAARLEVCDDAYRITVEDDGPGMSEEEKAGAFSRFFRGSNSAGQAAEGNGLGLPIVKTIIEAHDGTVRLEDADPQGLRVVIDLTHSPKIRLVEGQNPNIHQQRA